MKKDYLAYLRIATVALSVGCLLACASISASRGTRETELTGVQLGANRETIEQTLGMPIEVRKDSDQTIATYTFDRERPPQDPDVGLFAEVLFLPWQPVIWAVVADSREKEKGRLKITYGPGDTVVALDPLLVEARERFLRAACGDATAQYMAGYEQEYGLGVSRNLVKAYVWYSISAANGRAEANTQRDRTVIKMTPEQLTAAQNLVKTWSPPNCAEWSGGKP
jgi:hypothetical protein